MAIPDFQTVVLPVLRDAAGGQEPATRDMTTALADEFRLTPEERDHLLPSGTQATFSNRVNWSVSYLKQPGLLDKPSRGRLQITERGREVLKSPPSRITVGFLADLSPEFREFRTRAGARRGQKIDVPTVPMGRNSPA